ncbi:BTB/POZ and TAZ domain-containing protein 1-like [Chenopodium quinoa]|uniref:BTB/POZ and TAZ domain-containing protein 1-like n=1 Tax=Chenopodium quinoa TaxID=63459 RepID=UPI000B79918A|nr:BTB/POZ and TAZ domain-containing protein 1-like [Chenopodium quinoa]
MCPTNFADEFADKSLEASLFAGKLAGNLPQPDLNVVTSAGVRIPAHSHILAMASPVVENMVEKPKMNRKTGEKAIPILGVPCDAVSAFVRFLYTYRCTNEEMEKYGIHLLALSHVFAVPTLKQRCSKGLAERLVVDNVIDVLQLARLCDAPDLYLKGMKFAATKFKAIEKTEGYKFLQKHDPWLELEILQFIEENVLRKKRTKKNKEEQNLYIQLSEAMDCLVHICTEGCTGVGPYDMEPSKKKEPCKRFSTCQGLQLLIKHFATCKKRVNGGCSRCKRMWQLLKLHASMCEQPGNCRVPLCRQFKLKMQQEKKGDDAKWRLLVRKVVSAKTISSLSRSKDSKPQPKRELQHAISCLQGLQA